MMHASLQRAELSVVVYPLLHTLYAVLGEKRKQSLTIFPVVTQDGGRDSWDLAAGDAPTGA